jgi:hypothetical protein
VDGTASFLTSRGYNRQEVIKVLTIQKQGNCLKKQAEFLEIKKNKKENC